MEAALAHPPPPSHPSRACGNARRNGKPPICARPRRGGTSGEAAAASCISRTPDGRIGNGRGSLAASRRRVERPGRAPRPASTPSGACAASRRSARTGLMSVPCDLRSLRTSSSSAWRRQPTTMAANLMPRQTQPRLCPAVPRRSAHTRRWMMGPLFCLLLAAPPSTTLCTARRTTRAPGRPCDARVYYPALRRSAPSILRRGHTARGSGGP